MKESYKKLLIFELVLIIVFILNSFFWNILSGYKLVALLLLSIVLFKFFFGFEKDRHRYVKDIFLLIVSILLVTFIVFYLSGLLVGYAKLENFYSVNGLINFILPIALIIILEEFLRYNILNKAEGSKNLIVLSFILFSVIDISSAIIYNTFVNSYNIFMFVALTIFPALSKNIACTYIATKVGYKPNIVWVLAISLYYYLIPYIPDVGNYIIAIIDLFLPLIIMYSIVLFYDKAEDKYIKNKKNSVKDWVSIAITSLIVIVIVYFISGKFHYYAIAVGSGSMAPAINKGDIVVIERNNYDLKVGDIIAYKYNGVIVVHRLVKVDNAGEEYMYYSQGDANSSMDNYVIKKEDMVGKVRVRIPYLGAPIVWLNDQKKD